MDPAGSDVAHSCAQHVLLLSLPSAPRPARLAPAWGARGGLPAGVSNAPRHLALVKACRATDGGRVLAAVF